MHGCNEMLELFVSVTRGIEYGDGGGGGGTARERNLRGRGYMQRMIETANYFLLGARKITIYARVDPCGLLRAADFRDTESFYIQVS